MIINPTHLRIGNILNYKGEPHHVTLLSLDIDDEYQDIIGVTPLGKWSGQKEDWNRAFGDDLKFIPITEELLHKICEISEYILGFVLVDDGWPVTIKMESGGKFSILINWEYEIAVVQYVHQLQNLYFALTGRELTIKCGDI